MPASFYILLPQVKLSQGTERDNKALMLINPSGSKKSKCVSG